MKKTLLLFFIFICSVLPTFAQDDDDIIWNYHSDRFLESLKEGKNLYDKDLERELDKSIKDGLSINLLPVDLKTCLQVALENNYNIKISDNIKNQYKWLYRNAQAQLLPDFYYKYQIQFLRGEFLVGNILPDTISKNPIYSGISFEYPLIGNGAPLFDIAIGRKMYSAKKHNYQYTQSEILLKTSLAYYDLLKAKLNIEVLLSNLRDRHEQLKLMQARYHIGIGTKYDILRAEAQYADAKRELLNALNDLRLKQAVLSNLMGVEVTLTLYPYEHGAKTRELVQKKYDIDCLYHLALEKREDVKAKRAEIQSLVLTKNKTYTDFAPNINLSYQFAKVGTTDNPSLRSNHTWSIVATIPLGKKMGVGTITKRNAEIAKLNQARNELTNLERNIKETIVSSYYNSKTALEKVDANKKQVAAADEGLKYSLVGFDVGQNTFIDVLTSQTEKTRARQQLIFSIIEYNQAQIQMLFDTGTITQEGILLNYKSMNKHISLEQ